MNLQLLAQKSNQVFTVFLILAGIQCNGNEASILDCNLNTQISSFCDYSDLVGIQCSGKLY